MVLIPEIDLNLLRLLQTLYDERSVTRAAERLFLTPSAVSHALKRLRILFEDELFVRGPGGMVPTIRAHDAAGQLRSLLPKLHDVIHTPPFDPAASERLFTIACVPYLTSVLMPALAAGLESAAPNIGLDIRLLHHDIADDLDSGALDVALGNFRKVPQRLCVEEIIRDPYVWVVRRDHPCTKSGIGVAAIGAMPHVELNLESAAPHPTESYDSRRGLERLVIQNNLSIIERELAAKGLVRHTRFKAPDSIAAMALVARTDAIALIPSRAAHASRRSSDWRSTPLPSQRIRS